MKKLLLLLIFVLPVVSAQSEIVVSLNSDGSVLEEFNLEVYSSQPYESVEFLSEFLPLSVVYEGRYEILETDEGYLMIFYKDLSSGLHNLQFSVFYEDLVIAEDSNHAFRTSFDVNSDTNIKLVLPFGAKFQTANPEPQVSTDGERIILEWDDESNVAVWYELRQQNYVALTFLILGLIFSVMGLALLFSANRVRNMVEETLSSEELKVVRAIRQGIIKQKDIAKYLEFSKSKTSKVVRKLEEKQLIKKEPYFKTYKLKLKKIN